jgi:hypothetical protein
MIVIKLLHLGLGVERILRKWNHLRGSRNIAGRVWASIIGRIWPRSTRGSPIVVGSIHGVRRLVDHTAVLDKITVAKNVVLVHLATGGIEAEVNARELVPHDGIADDRVAPGKIPSGADAFAIVGDGVVL